MSWFRRAAVSESEIRGEIWRLGNRHFGYPLEGALEELRDPELPADRSALLRACVTRLQQ